MYERMRAAVSHLRNDINKIENEVPRPSTEHILQGTKVRDVILRSFKIGHKPNAPAEEEVSNMNPSPSAESGGIFKQDQRIQSWAKRYSQHNPIVMEGDPPLVGLNASQIRAMATMIGERMSLIQGVGSIFVLEVRCQNELTSDISLQAPEKQKPLSKLLNSSKSVGMHTWVQTIYFLVFTGTLRGAPTNSRLYIHKRRRGQSC